MDDFVNALAFEIKQEMAERYFGFRKRIETESHQYMEALHVFDSSHLAEIELDLQRIRCLLFKDNLFHSFTSLLSLPGDLVNKKKDPQSNADWKELFAGIKGNGFTRGRRLRDIIFNLYLSLQEHIDEYHRIFTQLSEEHGDITMEIDQFYRNNDLLGILNFLRKIDDPDGGRSNLLKAETDSKGNQNLERDLRIYPPPPVTSHLQPINPLPPLKEVKAELDKISKQAFINSKFSTINNLPF